jgi:3-hydroxymyristoyl/3-hydroxydecanoyl-(acyl carrier protein) dehydratase/acyl carrier protein
MTAELTATTDDDLLNKVREIVATASDLALDRVGLDDNIYEALGVDSVDAVAIFVFMTADLGVPEPHLDDDLAQYNTVRKLAEYARPRLGSVGRPGAPSEAAVPEPARVRELLPYGDEFRMIDEVGSFSPGGTIVTLKHHALDSPIIAAHFRDGPAIVPGTLVAEQVAQSALLAGHLIGELGSAGTYLLSQLRCEFLGVAEAPCVVRVELRANHETTKLKFMATAQVNGRVVARVEGTATAAPRTKSTGELKT